MEKQFSKDLDSLQKHYFKTILQPDSVRLVSGGFSYARNYHVQYEGKDYLARLMSSKQSIDSREKECLITDYVGKLGVGPQVYYQDAKEGILITEFINGRTAEYDDMVNTPNRNLIINMINKLHQSTPLNFPNAPTISFYIRETIERSQATFLEELFIKLNLVKPFNSLMSFEQNIKPSTLIHGDFNPHNILISDHKIYLIDWTDSGLGDPFNDISWHAIFFSTAQQDELLGYYFGQVDTLMRQKLICYYCLRLFLRTAWSFEQATMISKNTENLLCDALKQKNIPEPDQLILDLMSRKFTLDNVDTFILYSATMLHFLSKFTKTDVFLSAIEGLS